MRPLVRRLLVLAIAVPSLAYAGAGSVLHVDLGSGVVGAWTGTALGVARSFLPFLFVVAFAAEAFGKSPGEPRDFGAVVWRFVVVGVLLTFYGSLFGRFAALLDGVSSSIAPQETWQKLQSAAGAFLKQKANYQLDQASVAASNATSGRLVDAAGEFASGQAEFIGGLLIDAVVTLVILAGEAAFRIVGTFGQVLSMLLYVLGPLAIAASVPRASDAGAKWFRVFISVLLWPLISALLVGLLSEYALKALAPGSGYDAAYKSIALSGLLCVTAFAVPVIASALTGASLGAVSGGWASMGAWAAAAASGARAVGGAAGLGNSRFPPSGSNGQGGSGGREAGNRGASAPLGTSDATGSAETRSDAPASSLSPSKSSGPMSPPPARVMAFPRRPNEAASSASVVFAASPAWSELTAPMAQPPRFMAASEAAPPLAPSQDSIPTAKPTPLMKHARRQGAPPESKFGNHH